MFTVLPLSVMNTITHSHLAQLFSEHTSVIVVSLYLKEKQQQIYNCNRLSIGVDSVRPQKCILYYSFTTHHSLFTTNER